jgi:hypothetical protein
MTKVLGKSSTNNILCKLPLTCGIARCNNEVASDNAEKHFNKHAQPQTFLPDQLVHMGEQSFLAQNQKLAPKWSGLHHILRLVMSNFHFVITTKNLSCM